MGFMLQHQWISMDFNGVALSKSFQVRQAFCCKTYALGCPTHDPAVEEPVREEVHVVDVPPAPAPVTVVHHVHHYTTVSEPVEVEPAAAPYDCDAGQGSSEGSSQVCLDFLGCCRNGYLKKITLATWSSHGNSAIHYLFAEGPINSLKMQRTVRGVASCPCAGGHPLSQHCCFFPWLSPDGSRTVPISRGKPC